MLQQLTGGMGLELHVKGLPKWMNKMNPDKMSSADRHHIVSASSLRNPPPPDARLAARRPRHARARRAPRRRHRWSVRAAPARAAAVWGQIVHPMSTFAASGTPVDGPRAARVPALPPAVSRSRVFH